MQYSDDSSSSGENDSIEFNFKDKDIAKEAAEEDLTEFQRPRLDSFFNLDINES